MKKLIVLVFAFLAIFVASCADDLFRNCNNDSYPLWCPDHDACCPVGWAFSCGGACYQTALDAWNACGKFGGSTEYCRAE